MVSVFIYLTQLEIYMIKVICRSKFIRFIDMEGIEDLRIIGFAIPSGISGRLSITT
jgi:hypothetical protein